MTFNPINYMNAAAVFLLAVPVLLAERCGVRGIRENVSELHFFLERASLLLSCVFMVLPLNLTHLEFGYPAGIYAVIAAAVMLLCLIVNDAALLFMLKKGRTRIPAVISVIAVSVVFLMNGAVLRHPLLLLSGAVYFVTSLNHVLLDTESEDPA